MLKKKHLWLCIVLSQYKLALLLRAADLWAQLLILSLCWHKH